MHVADAMARRVDNWKRIVASLMMSIDHLELGAWSLAKTGTEAAAARDGHPDGFISVTLNYFQH